MIKKTFSTLNFSFLISGIIVLILCIYFSAESIRKVPYTSIFSIIVLLCSFIVLYIKFPIFIEKVRYQNELRGDIDIKKVNWITCLYYSLFTAEPSNFVSIFSKKYLVFHRNNRNCSFEWKYKKPKVIHKILDIILIVTLMCAAIFISKILKNWSDIENIGYYILIFAIALMLMFKKIILSYGLSVKAEEKYGCNVNVIYPYSTSQLSLVKQFGQAMPFTKTVMITQDVFSGNPIIKEYIIAHEVGHTHDNIRTFLIILSSVLSLAFVSFSPFWLANNGLTWFVLLPFILYLLYSMSLGYRIREKSEFFADKYALKLIGKEKCLAALHLMKSQNVNNKKSGNISNMFFKVVPIEKKVEFLNECKEKN